MIALRTAGRVAVLLKIALLEQYPRWNTRFLGGWAVFRRLLHEDGPRRSVGCGVLRRRLHRLQSCGHPALVGRHALH